MFRKSIHDRRKTRLTGQLVRVQGKAEHVAKVAELGGDGTWRDSFDPCHKIASDPRKRSCLVIYSENRNMSNGDVAGYVYRVTSGFEIEFAVHYGSFSSVHDSSAILCNIQPADGVYVDTELNKLVRTLQIKRR